MIKHKYVLGFVFSPDLKRVVLIEKKKPSWQAGKLNGVGGKIEWNESAVQAMSRELFEETNLSIKEDDWEWATDINGDDWHVAVYAAVSNQIEWAETTTEEQVFVVNVNAINGIGEIENVPGLIKEAIISLWCKVGFCD